MNRLNRTLYIVLRVMVKYNVPYFIILFVDRENYSFSHADHEKARLLLLLRIALKMPHYICVTEHKRIYFLRDFATSTGLHQIHWQR